MESSARLGFVNGVRDLFGRVAGLRRARAARVGGTPLPPAKIYVSLSTIPSRIGQVHRCIDSLLAQTLTPERIFLCVPASYRRFGPAPPIPETLNNYGERVQIVRCPEDYGPGTKLLGSVDLVPREADTLLVLVDDDALYARHTLAAFAAAYRRNPARCYSFDAITYKGMMIGQAYAGFSLPAPHLDGVWEFFDRIKNDSHVVMSDDMWISYFLRRKGIPAVSLTHWPRLRLNYKIFNEVDALRQLDGSFKRDTCMANARNALRAAFGE